MNILAKLVPGILGDKTCTVIGLILGYIISVYADFSSIVPAKYAGYVATGLGTLTAIFGAYIIRPGNKNAHDIATAVQSAS